MSRFCSSILIVTSAFPHCQNYLISTSLLLSKDHLYLAVLCEPASPCSLHSLQFCHSAFQTIYHATLCSNSTSSWFSRVSKSKFPSVCPSASPVPVYYIYPTLSVWCRFSFGPNHKLLFPLPNDLFLLHCQVFSVLNSSHWTSTVIFGVKI